MFRNDRSITAGPNRLRLVVDFLALDAIEEATGLETPDILRAILSGSCQLSVSTTTLWGLLLRHQSDVMIEEAAALMLGEHRETLGHAIIGLLQGAFNLEPAQEKDERSAKWSIKTFLTEWVKLGGSPGEFWRQTPKTYVLVMEGLAQAATRELDLCIVAAWHTAVFALNGYAGKLRPLSEFLTKKPQDAAGEDQPLANASLIGFFQSLKARGVPIDISCEN